MSFLNKDYQLPVSGNNYAKFKDGKNKFRILSSAITGYEYWTEDNKPVRSEHIFESTPDIRTDKDGKPSRVKHFWAFVVWSYDTEAIQIMEVTQATVQTGIKALVDSEEWGDPKDYDLTVTRTGESLETKYTVVASPPKAVSTDILDEYEKKTVNLEALYSGGNPFEKGEDEIPITDEIIK